ncbi:RagB/SusD family nutrient uptake outer membrane protein [Sinomicrobium pectinilyticum]|uniref:RagB/SusD family nutrient uptake outer membrane protein n=1 Tax=Sinomicrobium pectinilyticum TaxID=1084421 RepID=A0A3N0ERW9_SINP1|nr:RagB/SusD family nutrient uptake outer membrane protein [Sinomicrobium pectinilyticum]RNL90675.1 RagB/SusD family nutrient uptake outer membrane protein [Sinomicrobium pectinilyticum]
MKNILSYSNKRNFYPERYILILTFFLVVSCEDMVEVDPPKERLIRSEVFTDDAVALSAMTGIYSYMMNRTFSSGYNTLSVTFLCGMSSDEFNNYNTSLEPFSDNSLSPSVSNVSNLWSGAYSIIYRSNSILEGIAAEEAGVSEEVKKQLEGEAKFVRAFSYFYLINLFGDVPLYTTPDFLANSKAERSPVEEVYQQIIIDLEDAQNLLLTDYTVSGGERSRPNRYAAMALLSRVHLYLGNWSQAETLVTEVIQSETLYKMEEDLNQVFLANSSEAIWQLVPVEPGYNTNEGRYFILNSSPINSFRVDLSDVILASFEEKDQRREVWVGDFTEGTDTWFFPYKYKVAVGETLTEYSMVLRLAEQYLIRAEARAQQGNLNGAQEDLNIIRHRAGLVDAPAVSQTELLDAILQERRIEFFAEWGHRWFDLKRTGQADAVLGAAKPNWEPTDALYPIPEQEILNNPNITQNTGY